MRTYAKMIFISAGITAVILTACSKQKTETPLELTGTPVSEVKNDSIRIEFDAKMRSRVAGKLKDQWNAIGGFVPSEFVVADGERISEFDYISASSKKISDSTGQGIRYAITGKSESLIKTVEITLYEQFPSMAVYKVGYKNISAENITINEWTNNHYLINTRDSGDKNSMSFFSYESGSYEERPDWIMPVEKGFDQENYMGMNADDYGGGTPVCDIWRKDIGIGVGHLELTAKLVSIPVKMEKNTSASIGVQYAERSSTVKPEADFFTLTTFVSVHTGDYFSTLENYRKIMITRGIKFDNFPSGAYESIWCAWGYERDYNVAEVVGTIDKAKSLGFKWVGLDDGWQTAEGDWYVNTDKYPRGDADMKAFVDEVHAKGMKAVLWWAPMAVDPGTDLIKQHSDYLLINKAQEYQNISWWDAYYLCPAYKGTIEYTKKLVTKMVKEWGFDGFKLDGQHLNSAPPCYNPKHNHPNPETAYEETPLLFKTIYDTARSINPGFVVELCPCGTAYNFFEMPYFDQPVGSDPTSSYQVRSKAKTLKALMGRSVPYFADHVELSDNGDDFASAVGVGAVIGTKFTWPNGKEKLTSEREQFMKKWSTIYDETMLPRGNYRGDLYDIGFDKPETHVIEKDGKTYYAFYAEVKVRNDEEDAPIEYIPFDGKVELRGLEPKKYSLKDYVNNKDYGTIEGPVDSKSVEFDRYLLLVAELK